MTVPRGAPAPHRLRWQGTLLELHAHPHGLRSDLLLVRDGERTAIATVSSRAVLPLSQEPAAPHPPAGQDGAEPVVVVHLGLTGRISRADLLLPPAGGLPGGPQALAELPAAAASLAGVERCRFEPPPGSRQARVQQLARRHPRLYAARHVVHAAAKVAFGLLGLGVLVRSLLLPLLAWVREHVPHVDLPRIPWPDWHLPDFPWPDWDLPDVPWPDWDLPDWHQPAWLALLLTTAKFWVPLLVATVVAVREVRRHRTPPPEHRSPGAGAARTGAPTSAPSRARTETTGDDPAHPGP